MQGLRNLWLLRYACYAVLLVTSLGVQASRPDLASHLALPLNSPILPHEEKAK
jgi:hypothetical protein